MMSAFGIDHGVVSKADHKKEKEAGAAVGGAAVGQGAYQGAGYGAKHHNLNTRYDRFVSQKGNNYVVPKGWSRNQYDKAIHEHAQKFADKGGRGHPDFMRTMPKEIPGSKVFRVLGHTHRGKWGTALGTAATVSGGAAGYAIARKKRKDT